MKGYVDSCKRFLLWLLATLLCVACLPPLALLAAEGGLTNLHGLTGAWGYEGDAFVGKSNGAGDVFAIADERVAADDLFTYEATVTSVTSNPDFNASLIFGLKNPDKPTERFYDFGIMTGSHRFIRFDQTNGYPESGVDVGGLTEQKNTYHVKIVRNSAEEFEYFIDGVSVLTRTHLNFGGGYVGMMTNDNGTYENVKLTITGKLGAEESGFTSDVTGWTPINGTWSEGAKGYTGVTWGGDTWAYAADASIPAGESFVYEADVEIKTGNHAAGILFGVQNPQNDKGRPDRLYSFLIARGDGNVMVFTHKNGSAEWIEAMGMSEADKKAENYHLRMELLASGSANFYVNGTLYKSMTISGYEGGYLGLMVSGGTTATFNNIHTASISQPVLEGLTVNGAEMDSAFSADDHTYWVYVPYTTDKAGVTATFDESAYTVKVGNSKLTSGGEHTVSLNVGQTAVAVTVTDPDTGISAVYTVNFVRETNPETLYKEETRPKYHFTPYTYQMNDPNGLVYNAATGEYHLFFQCNRPFDTGVVGLTGTTSWGHAVSTDLVHWEELPLAIMPDDLGMAWSGSAVIDYNNTSGLFDESTPPASRMVLFYASVGGDTTYGYAKESMAYSTDGGRTFIKYEGNPVVKNPESMYGGGLRDPKVFWYEDETMEDGGIWVMVTVGNLHIFTSRDLIDWKHCGRPVGVDGQVFDSECPDLYPLPVDGDENNIKWVYTGGGIFYIIGHMEKTGEDTVMFVPETERIFALNGIADQGAGNPAPETYATQTFASEKLGRRVSISWLRDPSIQWKDKHWNSAQSLPMEHTLRTVNGEIKLFSYPVAEVDALRGDILYSAENVTVTPDTENILEGVSSTCCDLVATIDLGDATEVGFKVRMSERKGREELVVRYDKTAGKLYVDKTKTGSGTYLGVYEPDMVTLDGNRITIRILLDQICYDVYGNEGEVAVAGLIYSSFDSTGMEFFTNGTSVVESLVIYNMDESKNTTPDTPVEDETTGGDETTDVGDPADTTEASDTDTSDETTPEEVTTDTLPVDTASSETETDAPQGGCASRMGAGVLLTLISAVIAAFLFKKKQICIER